MKIMVLYTWKTPDDNMKMTKDFLPDDVDVVCLNEGCTPGWHSSTAYGIPGGLETIKKAERDGYDAVVILCNGDPVVQEARELVDIPVIGPSNASLHIAAMLGFKIGMLILNYPRSRYWNTQNIAKYGFESRVIQRGVKYNVEESVAAYERYKASGGKDISFIPELAESCIKVIQDDDVEALTLNCGGMIWARDILHSELVKRGYDVPVINPLPTAVEIARVLVNSGLSHSRITYPKSTLLSGISS